LERIRPYTIGISRAVKLGCVPTLQVVRYFGFDDGEKEGLTVTADGLEKLSGQHQLLGWHLSAEVMSFLVNLGAEIDADEYG
jgi:hypothetical protein